MTAKNRIPLTCDNCGKPFETTPSGLKLGKRFCQQSCYWEWRDKNSELRFWKHVDKTSNPNGCWVWTASKLSGGYGGFSARQKTIGAHRFSWILHNGSIPNGLYVCHHCDNPLCVNPDHLFLGTAKDNKLDEITKGRTAKGDRHWMKLHPNLVLQGAKHGMAKLTDEQVIELRRLYWNKTFSLTQLTKRYNLVKGHVYRIVNGIAWKHIPLDP